MNQQLGGVILLVLSSVLFLHDHVRAQSQTAPSSGDAVSNFQPSLAVVIGILGIMFLLTFFLLMYAKFCQRRSASAPPENQFSTLVRSRSRFSGIDKTVIESLPFFRFSSLKGSKQGLECAVCLSKFEDVEILRLLPKCKHAFHIDCIDHWLEKHSTCPICRHRVNPEDHTTFTYSNSLRRLANQSELGDQESNIEVFVQREEEHHGSSRFSVVGSSFRKTVKEEELLIQNGTEDSDGNQKRYQYHKHNHKITISDVVFKHRWSNVSSSDLMFLNSEMLNDTSSNRFSNLESNADIMMMSTTTRGEVENEQIMNIKEEMERKISFESKVGALNNMKKSVSDKDPPFASSHAPKCVTVNPGEKRSMSEITAVSRFGDLGMKIRVFKDSSSLQNNLKEERMRQIWFPIARRTAQWFVNREIRSQQSQNKQQPLDV